VLVGHVTKSGDVAGPKTVEHMVDCVLYLEGPGSTAAGTLSNLRTLRASKNRFGSADEVGVYEMTGGRLRPVSDPSSLFMAHRSGQEDLEGCAVAVSLEGMRAITVEVQALVVATPPAAATGGKASYGRRTVDGISYSRLLLLLGVLQKRCKLFFSFRDVYINVVGRMRLDRGEGNAADLAVAIALVSSLTSIPVRSDTTFVGEVGLLGELRSVGAMEKRVQEARRMGFSRVIGPPDVRSSHKKRKSGEKVITSRLANGMEWIQCDTLMSAINEGLVQPVPKRKPRTPPPKMDSGSSDTPGSIEDLGFEQPILDDEDNIIDDAVF
jgi:DNA repair protein RadA/Sms